MWNFRSIKRSKSGVDIGQKIYLIVMLVLMKVSLNKFPPVGSDFLNTLRIIETKLKLVTK